MPTNPQYAAAPKRPRKSPKFEESVERSERETQFWVPKVEPKPKPFDYSEPKAFDYSEAEWSAIDTEVQSVRQSSSTQVEKGFLRDAAIEYRKNIALRAARIYLTPKQSAQSWERIARLSARLYDLLQQQRFLMGVYEDDDELAEELDMQLPLVQKVQELAEIRGIVVKSSHDYYIQRTAAAFRSLETPRLKYQASVLIAWSCMFGGKLGISHGRSGKVQGPLARYFFAVVRPVMGAATPSAESLPDIVYFQKRLVKAIDSQKDANPQRVRGAL
jgi:hypothetical protein